MDAEGSHVYLGLRMEDFLQESLSTCAITLNSGSSSRSSTLGRSRPSPSPNLYEQVTSHVISCGLVTNSSMIRRDNN